MLEAAGRAAAEELCSSLRPPMWRRRASKREVSRVSGTRTRELCRRKPKDRSPNWPIFGRSSRLPASGKPIRKGEGLRPPPPRRQDATSTPPNRPIWAFVFRLPLAQLPFTGTRWGTGLGMTPPLPSLGEAGEEGGGSIRNSLYKRKRGGTLGSIF